MSKVLPVKAKTSTVEEPVDDLFSYAMLSREDEVSARADAALVVSHLTQATSNMFQAGLALGRQHSKMEYQPFLAWARDECHVGESMTKNLMKVSRSLVPESQLTGFYEKGLISFSAIEELLRKTTAPEVAAAVEKILVDGDEVTIADIRRLKAEHAKTVASIDEITAQLQVVREQIVTTPEVDTDAIRAEAEAQAERKHAARIRELSEANVEASKALKKITKENTDLKKSKGDAAAPADETNVVRLPFGNDTDIEADNGIATERDHIASFSGALGGMDKLQFRPELFWAEVGKTGSQGKMIYSGLLAANAMIANLIKEYAK